MSQTSQTIEIVVSPNGSTHVETKGFTGDACREASRFVETALGQQTDELLTADFYSSNCEQQTLKEGQ